MREINGPDFRKWREAKRLGLNETAKRLRLSNSFLSDWERAFRTMGPENQTKVRLFMAAHNGES